MKYPADIWDLSVRAERVLAMIKDCFLSKKLNSTAGLLNALCVCDEDVSTGIDPDTEVIMNKQRCIGVDEKEKEDAGEGEELEEVSLPPVYENESLPWLGPFLPDCLVGRSVRHDLVNVLMIPQVPWRSCHFAFGGSSSP